MIKYKQRCWKCKKNFVLASYNQRFILCYDCQKDELNKEVKGKLKKMFDIPEELYKKNLFLRDIKIKYLRYGKLSDKQVSAFKKVVKEMKEEKTI